MVLKVSYSISSFMVNVLRMFTLPMSSANSKNYESSLGATVTEAGVSVT